MLKRDQTKKLIRQTMEKDTRGIKKKNPRRRVDSLEKWENSGMWEKIIKEGEEVSKRLTESVRLLHVPHVPTLKDTDPPPPPGYLRKTFDARGGNRVYKVLLACSTQLHKMVKKIDRNQRYPRSNRYRR